MTELSVSVVPAFIGTALGSQIYTERRTSRATSSQETVLFIHGLGGTIDTFSPIYSSLLASLPSTTLLSFDWPGHGKSPLPEPAPGTATPLTLADLIASVETVISTSIPQGRITLVAHSAGTVIATMFLQEVSATVATRISHVVLIGGPIDLPSPAELVERQMAMAVRAKISGPQVLVDALLPALTGPTSVRTRPLATALVRTLMMAQTGEGYAAGLQALATGCKEANVDWLALAKSYSHIMVIGGDEDQLVSPSALDDLAAKLGARHATIQTVGQCVVSCSPSCHANGISCICAATRWLKLPETPRISLQNS